MEKKKGSSSSSEREEECKICWLVLVWIAWMGVESV